MKKESLEVQINDKIVQLEGCYVGSIFRVDRDSIDKHPFLTDREKRGLKDELQSNKNLLLSEE